jgi:hypothetical protein
MPWGRTVNAARMSAALESAASSPGWHQGSPEQRLLLGSASKTSARHCPGGPWQVSGRHVEVAFLGEVTILGEVVPSWGRLPPRSSWARHAVLSVVPTS